MPANKIDYDDLSISETTKLVALCLDFALLERRVETLFDAIKHGDENHQAWLKEAIDCHFKGLPTPAPR